MLGVGGICQHTQGFSHLTVVIIHDLSLLDTMRSHQCLPAAVVLRRGILENKEQWPSQVCLRQQSPELLFKPWVMISLYFN